MLRLAARRAAVQRPLLGALLGVVVAGATLLGVCALLLTVAQDRALEAGVARAAPDDVSVTAFATGIDGADARPVAADARAVLAGTLAPFGQTGALRASSAMRELGGRRLGYLSAVDGLPDRARLAAGRWPRPGTPEAVVLAPTARLLGLAPGDVIRLGREVRPQDAGPLAVRVVGVFTPLPGTGWERDPLGAAGHDPAYNDGRFPQGADAYGPFVVDPAALLASGSSIDRLEVTARPDLSAPRSDDLTRLGLRLGGADARLAAAVGDRVQIERIGSALPATLAAARAQQAATRSTVLVVTLLCSLLAATALALGGRLVAALRRQEAGLLAALGAGRGQALGAATAEAAALAVLAAALAVPLSALGYSALTRLPSLARAGLGTGPVVTPVQAGAVLAGALLLAALLASSSLRTAGDQPARGRLPLLARSGADLALVAVASTAWWQLRAEPAAAQQAPDAVRALAPALLLLAGAGLAVRWAATPLRAADRAARRSRGLVLPLAAFEAARRPRAVAAALLLALAAAAATFGAGFGATWQGSQRDQADARVGTGLALTLAAPPVPGQGAAVAAATGGPVSPVVARGIGVGQWLGTEGDLPRLVAVDTTRAGALLRGRPPAGRSWAEVGARLAPGGRAGGVPLAAGATVTGTAGGRARLRVLPRIVLEDAQGLRTPCDLPALPLNGVARPVAGCPPGRVVALALRVEAEPANVTAGATPVSVTLRVPGGAGAAAWSARSAGDRPELTTGAAAAVQAARGAAVLRAGASVQAGSLAEQPALLVATAFRPPDAVPVAVSRRLAGVIRAPAGARLTLAVGSTPVPAVVSGVVPAVPSAPGAVAVLADVDTLSRALIAAGDVDPAVSGWWAGDPSGGAAGRVAALRLGTVQTRAGVAAELAGGPLRAGLPAALGLLVLAAVLLALAGTALHVTTDVEARALEVARLRGLGVPRRHVFRGLVAQHGAVLALLLAAGALVGAAGSWATAPLLVRSDVGAAPVPAAVARWPWAAVAGLPALLLVGCLAAVAVVVAVQVRRADAAHLRVGS